MDLRIEAPDASRYVMALRHAGRKRRREIRIAGWSILLCGVVLLATPRLFMPSVILPLRLAYVVLGGVLTLFGVVVAFAPIRYKLKDPLAELAWDAVARFEQIPGQMLLFTAKGRFLSVPTSGLTSEELAELRLFTASRGGPGMNEALIRGEGRRQERRGRREPRQ